jgi:hypothetical protein
VETNDEVRPGEMIAILANVGVIAEIIFLAIELRQNNELLGAEARFAHSERAIDIYARVSSVPGLADAYAKLRTGEELSATELVQLQAHVMSIFRNFEWQFEEIRFGTMEVDSRLPAMRGC